MRARNWLVLRLAAPLMSFGSVSIDHIGPTGRWPGRSMLTGLIANALGYDWTEKAAHQALQDRIIHGALEVTPGDTMTDIQNAQLTKNDQAWTTRGAPEKRSGDSYAAPHRRSRDYWADAELFVVLTLEPEKADPTLAAVDAALKRPVRPLFLGRKTCLPTGPVLFGTCQAETVHAALQSLEHASGRAASWPKGEGPAGDRFLQEADLRVWSSGLHGGNRYVVEGQL